MIIAIFSNNDWQALNLTKYGTFRFLTIPKKIIKNNNKLPKGKEFSRSATGKVKNKKTFKKENL